MRVYDSNPWGFTYEDEEDEGQDWKPVEDGFDSNQVSISKPVVKDNTGTDPLTTLSSLEQMRSKLSASDRATLSATRSKEGPQLGSKGTADTADTATSTIDNVDTVQVLKQMVDKLEDRDRKTFNDL